MILIHRQIRTTGLDDFYVFFQPESCTGRGFDWSPEKTYNSSLLLLQPKTPPSIFPRMKVFALLFGCTQNFPKPTPTPSAGSLLAALINPSWIPLLESKSIIWGLRMVHVYTKRERDRYMHTHTYICLWLWANVLSKCFYSCNALPEWTHWACRWMHHIRNKGGNAGIKPKDKLQIGSEALPLAVLWRHVISCLDMPSDWQHPHTLTHTASTSPLPRSGTKAKVTLTLFTPKPWALRLVTALRTPSFGQEKNELSFWLSPTRYQLVSPQNFCQFTHTAFCAIPSPSCPLPPPPQPSLRLGRRGMASQLAPQRKEELAEGRHESAPKECRWEWGRIWWLTW